MTCESFQSSDQKVCHRCKLSWDMNDPFPPSCLTDEEVSRMIARQTLDGLYELLSD